MVFIFHYNILNGIVIGKCLDFSNNLLVKELIN
jgi:hypothetical protein